MERHQKEEHLQVPTHLDALAEVLEWFEQFKAPVMPHKVWLECQLALAEAFTNAVRHAHINKPSETPIDIEAHLTPQSIEFRIWDRGPGFAFDEYLQKASTVVDQLAEGGRGLGLIKHIADDLEYRQTEDQRNCLRIFKHYSSSPVDSYPPTQ